MPVHSTPYTSETNEISLLRCVWNPGCRQLENKIGSLTVPRDNFTMICPAAQASHKIWTIPAVPDGMMPWLGWKRQEQLLYSTAIILLSGPSSQLQLPSQKGLGWTLSYVNPTPSLYQSHYSCRCIITVITIYNELIDVYLFVMSSPLEWKHICLSLCTPSTMLDT